MGRTLIIEDPNTEMVETLGTLFHIDLFFFVSHIGFPFAQDECQQPASATLPSRKRTRSYMNIGYHRELSFDAPTQLIKLLCEGNVPRKVMLLPPLVESRIGLARSCVVSA